MKAGWLIRYAVEDSAQRVTLLEASHELPTLVTTVNLPVVVKDFKLFGGVGVRILLIRFFRYMQGVSSIRFEFANEPLWQAILIVCCVHSSEKTQREGGFLESKSDEIFGGKL
jgi:hypothetical protein